MSKTIILFLLCLFCGSLLPADNLNAQAEPFYKGQTLRVIVAFTPGGAYDTWARMITKHLDKYIPGNPTIVVQNMPGAGSISAANYFTSVAKPDGLTIGLISSALYFDQLIGRKEVNFDWSKFTWIGTPERTSEMLYIRADAPFKTIEDLRKATDPPKCGATGIGSTDYYFPKLLEDALGAKFNVVVGYQGAADIDLAVEKGEMHCRAGTLSSFFGREPGRTWTKTGFVRLLVQGGKKRMRDRLMCQRFMSSWKSIRRPTRSGAWRSSYYRREISADRSSGLPVCPPSEQKFYATHSHKP